MNRDERNSDDADWLLAQLASGRPARQDPPVAPPPAATTPPAAKPPVAQPPAEAAPAPRREESLDWFSLAEPPAPEAATRALPVIGGPSAVQPPVPPVAAPASPPVAPPAAPPIAPAGLPAWNPPFTVSRPGAVPPHAPPATTPLTAVEPPVGSAPTAAPEPVQSSEPVAPTPPPGPVTPTSQFALTWGSGDFDSEDAIRAAFRNLSDTTSATPAAPAEGSSEPPAGAQPPAVTPSVASAPEAEAASPFAGYTPPPVARQSFTPVTNPTPTPPQHPIAPSTAPAGWDERSARPAPPKHFDDELWSALVEADPRPPAAAPPTAWSIPSDATAPPAAAAPPATPEVPLAAPPAFGPPSAPEPAPIAPAAPDPRSSTPSRGFPFIEVRGDADAVVPQNVGSPAAEAWSSGRAPFPSFASAGGDDLPRQPKPQPAEPVDDLLAALGAGTARPSGDDGRGSGSPADRGGAPGGRPPGGTPPGGGGTPPDEPSDEGIGALGLAFGDHGDEDEPEPDVAAAARGGLFGPRGHDDSEDDSAIAREIAETGYFWNLTPDPSASDPKADPATAGAAVPGPTPDSSPFADDGVAEPFFPEATTPEPAAEPTPEPDWGPPQPEPEPNWSFGAGATELFPADSAPVEPGAPVPPPTDLPAAAERDEDPLAALFGAPTGRQPAAPPWPTTDAPLGPGAPFGGPAATNAGGPAGVAAPATRAPSASPHTSGSGGAGRAASSGGSMGGGRPGGNRTVRTLLWIAGALVVAVVLAGLFYLGTQLTGGGGGAAEAPDAAPTATEEPVAEPTAPQPIGVHAWNTLFGGECIDPFESAWAEEFSVVDCAVPHAAQLVYRGELPGDAAAPFPGEAEIAAQMNALCGAPGIIDVGLVAGVPDLQVQAAFPVTEEQWTDGERTYYCFANRAGGEPLTASITGPGPAA